MKYTIPNQLTMLRIILTPVFIYFFSFPTFEQRVIGAIVFIIAAITDGYDGYIARRLGVITRFGQFTDPLADKILVLGAFFLLSYLNMISLWMVIIIAVRDIFLTILRIYAIRKNMPIVTHSVGKWKTAIQMTYVIVVILFYTLLSYFYNPIPPELFKIIYFEICLFVLTLITVYSLIVYVKENFQLIVKFFQEFY